jgi:hypothetical protein
MSSVTLCKQFLTCLSADYVYLVFQNLENSPTQARVLSDYRLLWLELSHLATQTGFAFRHTYGLYLTHVFFMLALSTYATLSDIISGTFGNNILVTTCVFVSGFMIFAMCEGADDVVLKVSADTNCHHVISHIRTQGECRHKLLSRDFSHTYSR